MLMGDAPKGVPYAKDENQPGCGEALAEDRIREDPENAGQ
jgi:hypothetical protein